MDLYLGLKGEVSPVSLKCDFVLSLMEATLADKEGLQPVERTIIDRCVRMVYREYLMNPVPERMPILQDLYDILRRQPEAEAKRLATALEIYVTGSLNIFNHRTNVDFGRRVTCMDLEKLGTGLRKIAVHIMQDLTHTRVSVNFAAGKYTWCYFDEFHVLLQDELTARYFVTIWKMLRKKGCIPVGLNAKCQGFACQPGDREHTGKLRFHHAAVPSAGRPEDSGGEAGDQPSPTRLCDPQRIRRRAVILR